MSNSTKITNAELEKAEAMIKEGYKIQYIALKLNRSASGLYRRLDKNGKRSLKAWTAEEKSKAKELKANGLSDSKIGEVLGRNRVAVNTMFHNEKVKKILEGLHG